MYCTLKSYFYGILKQNLRKFLSAKVSNHKATKVLCLLVWLLIKKMYNIQYSEFEQPKIPT